MSTGGPSPGVKCGQGVMLLTTHPHPVLRSSMRRSYTSSLAWYLYDIAGQLYFCWLLLQNGIIQSILCNCNHSRIYCVPTWVLIIPYSSTTVVCSGCSKAGRNFARNVCEFCLQVSLFTTLGFFTCCKILHGDYSFISSPKKVVLRTFSPLKIHHPQPGLNLRTSGPMASMITITLPRTCAEYGLGLFHLSSHVSKCFWSHSASYWLGMTAFIWSGKETSASLNFDRRDRSLSCRLLGCWITILSPDRRL
jgi:hypothetical protein